METDARPASVLVMKRNADEVAYGKDDHHNQSPHCSNARRLSKCVPNRDACQPQPQLRTKKQPALEELTLRSFHSAKVFAMERIKFSPPLSILRR